MTLLALGDSTSCGEGVGVRVPHEQTWPVLLADQLGLDAHVAARPGARARDLLAQVAGCPPGRLATVLVGCNDVIRPTGVPLDHDLGAALDAVSSRVEQVVVMRLHDPTRLLPLAGPLRSVVVRRVCSVNAALDRVVRDRPGVVVVDLDRVVGLRHRSAWAVDRLHPSPHGHAVLATAVARALGAAVSPPPPPASAPGLVGEAVWLLRHGLPWVALRGPELLPGRRVPA